MTDKANALQKRGDTEGHPMWKKVADEIEKGRGPRSRRESTH